MPRDARVFSVLLACPADVQEEAGLVRKAVEEVNLSMASLQGAKLEVVDWQTHASPGIGSDAQDVINRQLPDCDIFLGVMWTRFGTATPRAGSGTEEEFDRALTRHQKDSSGVRILFYFKQAPLRPDAIDSTQLQKVKAFRERLKQEGVLYGEFDSSEEFERQLRLHLVQQLQALVPPSSDPGTSAWAERRFRQGEGLLEQGKRLDGCESLERLAEACQAFSDALTVYTPDRHRLQWMATKCGLGSAQLTQGERLEGEQGAALLRAASQTFKQALEVCSADDALSAWAQLVCSRCRADGQHAMWHLHDAEVKSVVDRAAQSGHTRAMFDAHAQIEAVLARLRPPDKYPREVALAHNTRGGLLLTATELQVGERKDQEYAFQHAIHILGGLRDIYSRDGYPEEWADLQYQLGRALYSQFVRLRDCLVGANERGWNKTDADSIGLMFGALDYIGDAGPNREGRQDGLKERWEEGGWPGLVDEACTLVKGLFEDALEVLDLHSYPAKWAAIQYRLGKVLYDEVMLYGANETESGTERLLERAHETCVNALNIFTRVNNPLAWAKVKHLDGSVCLKQVFLPFSDGEGFYAKIRQLKTAEESLEDALAVFAGGEEWLDVRGEIAEQLEVARKQLKRLEELD